MIRCPTQLAIGVNKTLTYYCIHPVSRQRVQKFILAGIIKIQGSHVKGIITVELSLF